MLSMEFHSRIFAINIEQNKAGGRRIPLKDALNAAVAGHGDTSLNYRLWKGLIQNLQLPLS